MTDVQNLKKMIPKYKLTNTSIYPQSFRDGENYITIRPGESITSEKKIESNGIVCEKQNKVQSMESDD